MSPEGRRACVIGAGLPGLALAIRLQAAGVATTLVEARGKPGGRAVSWQKDGFTFDAGPTAVVDPAGLRALWELTGHDMATDVELLPVSPACRFSWPDGTTFDHSGDLAADRREIAALEPGDIAGYDALLDYGARVQAEADRVAGKRGLLNAAAAVARLRGWRSAHAQLGRLIRHDKLREAASFPVLLAGGNPLTASALQLSVHHWLQTSGVWWPRGGTNRLVAGLARHFERLGGELRLHDPAVHVALADGRAHGIETQAGWSAEFDAVASGADVVHTYRDLLRGSARGTAMARRLAKRRFGPSVFAVHFGIQGSWPGIPHHHVLFSRRYTDWLEDVFERGVLPADFPIYLHHPTVTDPSLAPEGQSVFSATVPVAHMGKLAVDWEQVGPLLERRILDEIGRRLIPDIHDRIVDRSHSTPRDLARDPGAHLGTAFGPEPILTRNAFFPGHNRDEMIGNFYLVGAATHPGAGIPGALASARRAAELMLKDLTR